MLCHLEEGVHMKITTNNSCEKTDWQALMLLLKLSGMGTYTPELHKKAFENSYRTVFLYDGSVLIGCGRVLSDGAYQAAIYDVAVDEKYRGHGLGKQIINELLKDMEHMNILLYASPGKEAFYQNWGFQLGKTCMIRFQNPALMKEKGFI